MSATAGRLVPWTSWDEWDSVRASLVNEPRRALEIISAWRCRGRLPLGVDATAAFIESSIDPPKTTHAQRLHLSMALTRLVNGVADASQTSKAAKSVSKLASSAGLPRSAVDARHEATHGELPSLAALKKSARECLEWLERSYWSAQKALVEGKKKRAVEVVRHYSAMRAAAASASRGGGDDDGNDDDDDFGEGAGSTSSSELQRRKRQLLVGELRELVPRASPKLLASIVALSVRPPPKTTEDGSTASPIVEGWREVVRSFEKGWPGVTGSLVWLVADELLSRSLAEVGREDDGEKEKTGAATAAPLPLSVSELASWAEFLVEPLRAPLSSRPSQKKGKAAAAATTATTTTNASVAASAAAPALAAALLAAPKGSELSEALRRAAEAFSEAGMGSGGEGKGKKRKGGDDEEEEQGNGGGASKLLRALSSVERADEEESLAAAEAAQEALLAARRERQQQRKGNENEEDDDDSKKAAPPSSVASAWSRVPADRWWPCPLGSLPRRGDGAGRTSVLEWGRSGGRGVAAAATTATEAAQVAAPSEVDKLHAKGKTTALGGWMASVAVSEQRDAKGKGKVEASMVPLF